MFTQVIDEHDPFCEPRIRASVCDILEADCDALADCENDLGLDDRDDMALCEAHGHADCERCYACECGADCAEGECEMVRSERREAYDVDRFLDDRDY